MLVLCAGLLAPCTASADTVGNLGIILKAFGTDEATSAECTLGAATADAVRSAAGTDIALLPGGDFYSNLLPGDVTQESIENAFSQAQEIGTAEITVQELFEILEISVSAMVLDEDTYAIDYEASRSDGFLQISGFVFEYDMSAMAGERIYYVKLEDGSRLSEDDTDTVLTVAATTAMLDGGYGYPSSDYEDAGFTQVEALTDYIAAGQITSEFDGTGRIKALGTSESTLISEYPTLLPMVVLILVIMLLMNLAFRNRSKLDEPYLEI